MQMDEQHFSLSPKALGFNLQYDPFILSANILHPFTIDTHTLRPWTKAI